MQRNRPPSPQMIRVLRALASDPTRWRYGYDLGHEVGLKSGSLYPMLVRLADRGWLEASWETPVEGKPPRHLYRLTADGLAVIAALPHAGPAASTARQRRRLQEA
jgi:DNA-binding PadR family transcriptional regulator